MNGTPEQERALSELVAPAHRQLLHRGYECSDITDRESTTTITAWVSTENGTGTGLFRITPDGAVIGHFESGALARASRRAHDSRHLRRTYCRGVLR